MEQSFKEIVLQRLAENNVYWFTDLAEYTEYFCDNDDDESMIPEFIEKYKDKFKIVEYFNYGDGQEQYLVIQFNFDDETSLLVKVEGCYSSWGEDSWEEVYEAEPYKYEEVRYKRK